MGKKTKEQLTQVEIEKLKRYRDTLNKRAVFASSELFPNLDDFHASIVLTTMLRHATDVSMFEDAINGDLSDDYDYFNEFLPALEQHIAVGHRFRLVVTTEPEIGSESKVCDLLKRYSDRENVDVRIASPAFKKNIRAKFAQHLRFAVADGQMFRYEMMEGERRAYCSFNHAGYTSVFEREFNSKFDTCKRLFPETDAAASGAARAASDAACD